MVEGAVGEAIPFYVASEGRFRRNLPIPYTNKPKMTPMGKALNMYLGWDIRENKSTTSEGVARYRLQIVLSSSEYATSIVCSVPRSETTR